VMVPRRRGERRERQEKYTESGRTLD
jgi:hypothetical protein